MTDRVDEARVESVAKEHGAADAGIPAVSPTTIGISGIRSIPRWVRRWVVPVAVSCGVLVTYAGGDNYYWRVGSMIAFYAMAAAALNVITGLARQISFGHNAFVAIGAYASAIGTTRESWSPVYALAVGIVVSAVVAAATAIPIVRLRGHYLAMATLAIGLAMTSLASSLSITGGTAGLAGIPFFEVGGWRLSSLRATFLAMWIVLAVFVVGFRILAATQLGREMVAVGTDEISARATGINPVRVKVVALVISAAMASLAGSLYAHLTLYVSPEPFGLSLVVLLFSAAFIGGLGTATGPVVGACVIGLLPEVVAPVRELEPTVLGILLIGVIYFMPRGVLGGRK